MFSSRTLAERNNDWAPWLDEQSGFRYTTENPTRPHRAVSSPSVEFQYGKLPANPILVGFRDAMSSGEYGLPALALVWVGLLEEGYDFHEDVGDHDSEHRLHAHRVLTLLATLNRSDS